VTQRGDIHETPIRVLKTTLRAKKQNTPGKIRTSDQRIRNPLVAGHINL
jgi:hypothetical protein